MRWKSHIAKVVIIIYVSICVCNMCNIWRMMGVFISEVYANACFLLFSVGCMCACALECISQRYHLTIRHLWQFAYVWILCQWGNGLHVSNRRYRFNNSHLADHSDGVFHINESNIQNISSGDSSFGENEKYCDCQKSKCKHLNW